MMDARSTFPEILRIDGFSLKGLDELDRRDSHQPVTKTQLKSRPTAAEARIRFVRLKDREGYPQAFTPSVHGRNEIGHDDPHMMRA